MQHPPEQQGTPGLLGTSQLSQQQQLEHNGLDGRECAAPRLQLDSGCAAPRLSFLEPGEQVPLHLRFPQRQWACVIFLWAGPSCEPLGSLVSAQELSEHFTNMCVRHFVQATRLPGRQETGDRTRDRTSQAGAGAGRPRGSQGAAPRAPVPALTLPHLSPSRCSRRGAVGRHTQPQPVVPRGTHLVFGEVAPLVIDVHKRALHLIQRLELQQGAGTSSGRAGSGKSSVQ